jgi:tetratricopeptide (TPR) repeat protein
VEKNLRNMIKVRRDELGSKKLPMQQKRLLKVKMPVIDKKKVLEKYRNTVGIDSVKARELIKRLDDKEDYYLLQCIAQTYLDECRFEDDGDSQMRTYVDKRKWRMAERFIIKAFSINPDSAHVLYTMGEVRKINGQADIAIYCFEKIIQLSVRKIAYGEYGRGIPFAKELINDSKFELYRLYHKDDPSLSKRYLSMYKKGLIKGVKTIFKPVSKFLLD